MTFEMAEQRLRLLAIGISDAKEGSVRLPDARWGGAGTVIANQPGDFESGRFGTPPFIFVTPHVKEMSWLFFKCRDAVSPLEGYGKWKEEFFGRLARAGQDFSDATPSASLQQIQLAILLEALFFVEKLRSPDGIDVLPVVVGQEIADDYSRPDFMRLTTWEGVRDAWHTLGVEVSE